MGDEEETEMPIQATKWEKRRVSLNQSTTGKVTVSVTFEGTLTKEEVCQGVDELMAEALEIAKKYDKPIEAKKK